MKSIISLTIRIFAFLIFLNGNVASQRIAPEGLEIIPKDQRANLTKRLKQFISYAQKNDIPGLCKLFDQKGRCMWCGARKYRKNCAEPVLNTNEMKSGFRYKAITPDWHFYRPSQEANRYKVDIEIETYANASDFAANKISKDVGAINIRFERGKWYFSSIDIYRMRL